MELMRKFIDLIYLQRHIIDTLAIGVLQRRELRDDELEEIKKAADIMTDINQEVHEWTSMRL